MWSSYIILCLMAAWICTTDSPVRLSADRALEDYQRDFPQGHGQMRSMTTFLEEIYRQLHLFDRWWLQSLRHFM